MLIEIDQIVRNSLTAFAADVSASHWSGRREREAVSLYVLRHLAGAVRPESFLHDAAQIGVEVPIPQIPKESLLHRSGRPKAQVCKDIVLWPKPAMTCWDETGQPTVYPAAVILWKSNETPDEDDVTWLQEYAMNRIDFVGFAVATAGYGGSLVVRCARVCSEGVVRDWFDSEHVGSAP